MTRIHSTTANRPIKRHVCDRVLLAATLNDLPFADYRPAGRQHLKRRRVTVPHTTTVNVDLATQTNDTTSDGTRVAAHDHITKAVQRRPTNNHQCFSHDAPPLPATARAAGTVHEDEPPPTPATQAA